MIEAVPERHESLAAAMQAHLRENAVVEAVALQHGDVYIAQCFSELSTVLAFIADYCAPGELNSAGLLFDGRQRRFVYSGGTDVQDFEWLGHVVGWSEVGSRMNRCFEAELYIGLRSDARTQRS